MVGVFRNLLDIGRFAPHPSRGVEPVGVHDRVGIALFGEESLAQTVARRMTAGMIGVNQGLGGAPGMPWVGARQSGYGFHAGPMGHRQFCQVRVVSEGA